jgi:6-phosphofructokinase 1
MKLSEGKMIKKIGVLTSGGDAPGMNAAIRAVTRAAIQLGIEVYGIHDGYLGMYEGNIERLFRRSVSEKMGQGGTFLGTARLKNFVDKEIREVAIKNLKSFGIDALVAIGGDGTYRGALSLSEMGIPVVCLPGTIDNDIAGTDSTIGFDTALNTIVDAVDKLRDTSNSHRRCSIVEVMGRNCGDIAVWAAIASGAEVCISKETGFNLQEVLDSVTSAAKAKRHAIIILAENIIDINSLAKSVTDNTPFEARATVLGHVQRGGKPTVKDRVLASEMGAKAVDALIEGKTHHCMAIQGSKVIAIPIEEALEGDDTIHTLEKYEVFKKLW